MLAATAERIFLFVPLWGQRGTKQRDSLAVGEQHSAAGTGKPFQSQPGRFTHGERLTYQPNGGLMKNAQPFGSGRPTTASATILVIDELLLVSSALAYTLQGKGFDAHSLRVTDLNGIQQAARAFVPGLVLLDLDLGSGPDGLPINAVDLIGPLCAQGWTVMVMTGTAQIDRIAEAIARGAANWIVKGATFAELVHAADEIMAGRGQLGQVERRQLGQVERAPVR